MSRLRLILIEESADVSPEIFPNMRKGWEVDKNTELFEWWISTTMGDWSASVPKTDEYGSHDLEIMGAVLAIFCGLEQAHATIHSSKLPVFTELACWFYVLGKVARLVSDYLAARPGKPDTWHDITVYSMMARRIQDTGRWP